MIGLAARFAVAGGRDAAVRLALTVAGVGFGAALLMFALSFEPAAQERAFRLAQRGHHSPSATDAAVETGSGSGRLLVSVTEDRFRDRTVRHVFVAATGEGAPVPPGLPRLPAPGEAFVSPALTDLLDGGDGRLLRGRLPDRLTAGQLGQTALLSPWEAVAWTGVEPDLLASSGDATIVGGFPIPASRTGWWSAKLPVRLGIAVALIGLVVPALIFVGVMARLGAAQRARRLAVLRLLGATPTQARLAVAFEAAVAATVGVAAGVGLFAALRPLAARMSIDGARWFPTDFSPPAAAAVAVLLAVPVLSALAAVVALRRVVISPLGIARQAADPSPSSLRLAAVALGTVGLVAAAASANVLSTGRLVTLAAISLAVLLAGLPVAGPWLTAKAADVVAARARRPSVLLAARRLQADPTSSFRAASGVMAALFVATVFYAYSNGNIGEVLATDLPHGDRGVYINTSDANPALVARLLDRLADIEGVRSHLAVRHAYGDPDGHFNVNIADCNALNTYQLAHLESCPATSVFVDPRATFDLPDQLRIGSDPDPGPATMTATIDLPRQVGSMHHGDITVIDLHAVLSGSIVVEPELLPEGFIHALPVRDVLIETDGTPGTIERIRNLTIPVLPGRDVDTQSSLAADLNRPIHEAERGVHILVAITLIVAAASTAATTAGTILERRRPFTLLRASGAPITALHLTILVETAIPLVLAAVTATGLGLAAAAVFVEAVDANFMPPAPQVAALTGAAVAAGLAMAAATLPLVSRATVPQDLRTE